METARVLGNATATVRHPSLDGWRLIVLQPLDINNQADGFPILAIDELGVARNSLVFFTSDGSSIREMVGRNDCPVRFAVQGIIDNS
ncbi:MAG: EutN/CcmL family microcompartment protein [Planctomycetaceae bacterium]